MELIILKGFQNNEHLKLFNGMIQRCIFFFLLFIFFFRSKFTYITKYMYENS